MLAIYAHLQDRNRKPAKEGFSVFQISICIYGELFKFAASYSLSLLVSPPYNQSACNSSENFETNLIISGDEGKATHREHTLSQIEGQTIKISLQKPNNEHNWREREYERESER